MQKIRKILAPTDLSELSCVGVRYALEMAKELSAEVIVYHVVPVGGDWFSGYEKLGLRAICSQMRKPLWISS
jgi:nucleotide-binding universal stress UspA family protein